MGRSRADGMCLELMDCTDIEERDLRWVENILNRNDEHSAKIELELIKLYDKHIGFGREAL